MSTILFIASPSLGALDGWLPVLAGTRERMPDANLILVAPKPGSLETTDPNSILVVMGDSIFDSVLTRAIDGRWNRAYSIASAIRMEKKLNGLQSLLFYQGFTLQG